MGWRWGQLHTDRALESTWEKVHAEARARGPAGHCVSARPAAVKATGLGVRYSWSPAGPGRGGYICEAPTQEASRRPRQVPLSAHPLLPDPAILGPRSKAVGGRSHPPLTGLSHPGDAETGEAEEHDRDERHQQVHLLGPHAAGRVWQRAAQRWRRGAGPTPSRAKQHASACAPGRAPLRTLPTVSAPWELPSLRELCTLRLPSVAQHLESEGCRAAVK